MPNFESDLEIPTQRQVFCNRTLNMRAIRAIGYDMDYTLIHYKVEEWERRAYEYLKQQFISQGWPVHDLEFNPSMVCRGLIIDTEHGNLLKVNRFGFIKRSQHGTQAVNFDIQRKLYSRTIVDLAESKWVFLNTLFSLSEGCMYAQLVDLLDLRLIPEVLGYADLYDRVRRVLEAAHMEGRLKAEIIANPDRFVILEEETPLALLDQYYSGKKLMLITNSEWNYTVPMMTYAFDRFLPKGMSWRDLFEIVIIGARKPHFFTMKHPFFEVINDEGFLKPTTEKLKSGVAYLGGSAQQLEKDLGLSGDEILYVGDHMFGDVHVSKNTLRWRTALILRELEDELSASHSFKPQEAQLTKLMESKERIENQLCQAKLNLQRNKNHYGPHSKLSETQIDQFISELKKQLDTLDQEVGHLVRASSELNIPSWGLLMRAGNDKSYLAYQVERYADIYTSRVSNLMSITPFSYLRSPRGSLPHDPS